MEEYTITKSLLKSFEQHLYAEEKSKKTVEKYLRDLIAFAAFAGDRILSKELVIEYKSHLLNSEYAARSVNSMLASINSFLTFLNLETYRAKAVRIQRKVFCPEEKELTKAEYFRLLQAAKRKGEERINLVIQTICATGIRVSELRFITVEAANCGEAVVYSKGKTRVVFLVKDLRKKLLRYAATKGISGGSIFITRTGKPLDRTNIWRDMKRLCKESNVNAEKVFPHNLRHLFARVFYGLEKDIAKLADILGHSSIDTTRIYIVSTGIEHRKNMARMHLIT